MTAMPSSALVKCIGAFAAALVGISEFYNTADISRQSRCALGLK